MNNTTYINFSAFDYNKVDTLSTYCIELTPLTFIPDIPVGFPHRLVWDFGDETTSKSPSATKVYNFPGVYNVSLIVYDCDTNAQISTYTKQIVVYNYIPFTFNIKVNSFNFLLTEDGDYILDEFGNRISVDGPTMDLKNGQFSNSLDINAFYPSYQTPSSIFYIIKGSNSLDYWEVKDNKFSHLQNTRSLYEKIYNYHIKTFQFKPIDKVDFDTSSIYARMVNNIITPCSVDDEGAVFVGLSGTKSVYLKDDTVVEDATINFKFDKVNNYVFNRNNYVNTAYHNNLGILIKYNILENDEIDRLSVTSNGLDGEFYSISSFDISTIKYYDTKIPFVVKIKDLENTSPKNFERIALSALDIRVNATVNGNSVVLSSGDYSIYSLEDSLSAQTHNGAFRGYITFPNNYSTYLDSVYFSISGSFLSDGADTYNISTESTRFSVYPTDYYDVWKMNEDFDPKATLMDLRFQETLIDKNVLFENFLGGILGDSESDHEAIGVKIYEKIANFTQNTQDVDTCELDFLDSNGQFVGYNEQGEEYYNYPEKIRRLVNLGSIDKSKLIGTTNKFRENFDIRGRSSKTEYGINIGDKIQPNTYIVDREVPIVALEKFSNTYILLNTYRPSTTETIPLTDEFGNILTDEFGNVLGSIYVYTTNYPLSAYSSDWGWPLVLPAVFDFVDIEKYYLFFDYVEQYDNTILDGVLDFDNDRTKVALSAVNVDIFKHMSMDVLYQTLLPT